MSGAEAGHHSASLSPGQGQFTFAQISRRLARLSGRLEVDEDEAYRILFHFIGLYEGGHFGYDEVVALYGNPPRYRPLKSLPKKAQRLLPIDWRDGVVSLVAPALQRYLEHSTLDSAPLLLRELFGERATEPKIAGPAVRAEDNGASPAAKGGGTGKRDIPKKLLMDYLHDIKEEGGPAPAADPLLSKIKAAFPEYHVTRDDVRSVHRDVFSRQGNGPSKPERPNRAKNYADGANA